MTDTVTVPRPLVLNIYNEAAAAHQRAVNEGRRDDARDALVRMNALFPCLDTDSAPETSTEPQNTQQAQDYE